VNPPTTQHVIQERVDPAVYLLNIQVSANLSVPQWTLNNTAWAAVWDQAINNALNGDIGTDLQSVENSVFQQIAANPSTYIVADPSQPARTLSYTLPEVASAFGVTPNGVLVTAAHAVVQDPKEVNQAFAQRALPQLDQQDQQTIAQFLTDLSQQLQIPNFTPDQENNLLSAVRTFEAQHLTVTNESQQITAQSGVAIPGIDNATKGIPVSVIGTPGQPYPGKDVALLKIDGQSNLPTVPLAAGDNAVSAGDNVYVAGYPAASTILAGASGGPLQPTVTEGPLTAVKSTDSGVPVLQTQAPISGGNSGGPLLDAQGQVVGVVVASALNPDGTVAEGQNFAIPISVVWDFLNQNGVHPSQSITTQLYDQALNNVDLGYYKRALPLLQQVNALQPGSPYVQEQLAGAQQAILNHQDRTPTSGSPLPLVGAAVGGLVVIGLVSGALIWRRRRKQSQPVAPANLDYVWVSSNPVPGEQPVTSGAPMETTGATRAANLGSSTVSTPDTTIHD
jgi:S1-C subfamily serine protease